MVGLTIIHIFGFESPEALKLAEKCGIAFQLTKSCATFAKTPIAAANTCRWKIACASGI
jgi:hypothetical protein